MDRGFLKYDKKTRMKSEYWIEWQKEAMQAEYSGTRALGHLLRQIP